MYCFCGEINWGHVVRPLYGGGPYLRESVVGGSTVLFFCRPHVCLYPIAMCHNDLVQQDVYST